ncbi:UDP-N-acetylmuramoyl-tripeptide--D-alanyl-D-alanine ligase [Colwellia psychrerythraea]|uniref:UDP-N-acetylmuramoyl-tripeptide--D-alanyl-D-alanine ligase n=1 Tax=Colwellia psychrerythraea TaxID=28229 RepID=A0A099KNP5_COLPS|nr:UDP-N-acetylmuramoyl-tripeptide--D-alanyl-D-alanine ligase [Colwellia psychrerythraea]KGJ91258.1 UDP-N-acetylmuramoylalanyl-D-glutamyl-2,6-diaminopimelate/D-alanyl-D-alanyl ligase [Colwellia psychrerythraea]
MIAISLSTLAQVTDGQLIKPEDATSVSFDELAIDDLVIDSRAIVNNPDKTTAFLALKGPSFDGHRFAPQVIEQGCQLLIVDHHLSSVTDTAQLVVSDTRIALGKIAAFVKKELGPKTVGITGSSGKTTVKEMVAAILSRLGKVLATNGNFNNDIGVPLTLLRLDRSHDFAVIEMGANHIGEIAYTTVLTKPDVAVINNIAAAHLEGFGDLCGVARAKGEIFSGLGENGVALYNQDTKYTNKWQWRLTDKTVRTFSCVTSSPESKANCYSENANLDDSGCASFTLKTDQGSCEVKLTVPGKHNVCNAVAAACIALEFGAKLEDIRLGLAQMQPVQGRLNLHQIIDNKTGCNIKLIDDSYNANLESVKAATQLLSSYPGKQLLILGDMGELGSDARRYHQEVGEFAKSQQLNTLLSLGVLSQSASDAFAQDNDKNEQSRHFNKRADLMAHLLTMITQQLSTGQQDIAILVKGSRSAHMEHVVTALIKWFGKMNTEQSNSQESIVRTNQACKIQANENQSKEGKA